MYKTSCLPRATHKERRQKQQQKHGWLHQPHSNNNPTRRSGSQASNIQHASLRLCGRTYCTTRSPV